MRILRVHKSSSPPSGNQKHAGDMKKDAQVRNVFPEHTKLGSFTFSSETLTLQNLWLALIDNHFLMNLRQQQIQSHICFVGLSAASCVSWQDLQEIAGY